jgi:hypothetical protein
MLQGGDGSNIKIQGQGSSAEIYQKDIYACKVRSSRCGSSSKFSCFAAVDLIRGVTARAGHDASDRRRLYQAAYNA